jgi:hypothetical protein
MKYLKIFERIYGQDEVRLKEFCEETLAYLLDDGDFKLRFTVMAYDKVHIHLNKTDKKPFEWDDISSDFIYLIELLKTQRKGNDKNGYTLNFKLANYMNFDRKHVKVMSYKDINATGNSSGRVYTVSDIIDDNIEESNRHNINEISFMVKLIK